LRRFISAVRFIVTVIGLVGMGLTYAIGGRGGKWRSARYNLDAAVPGHRFEPMPAALRRYRPMLGAALLAGLTASCGDPAGDSDIGQIEVTILADGTVPTGVGYTLTLNGGDPRLLPAAGTLVYTGIPTGTHTVLLFGMPEGCEVRGTNPQLVQVFRDATVRVAFSVGCPAPTTGGFRVEVSTIGEPLDDDGYQLSVAGSLIRVIDVNAFESYLGLEPGIHLITLKDVIPECRVHGGNPQPFTVVPGKQVLVRLQVICGDRPDGV
jgi:hypothetical protein